MLFFKKDYGSSFSNFRSHLNHYELDSYVYCYRPKMENKDNHANHKTSFFLFVKKHHLKEDGGFGRSTLNKSPEEYHQYPQTIP